MQADEFFSRLCEQTGCLTGVEWASLAASVPMAYGGGSYAVLKIDGYQPPKDQKSPAAGYNAVSSGYFETMRIRLLRGREVSDSHGQNSQPLAGIDQTRAAPYWRCQEPLRPPSPPPHHPHHPIQDYALLQHTPL